MCSRPAQIFVLMAAFFAVAAWPHVARGVRAIVATERTREYADAARAAGAGPVAAARALPAGDARVPRRRGRAARAGAARRRSDGLVTSASGSSNPPPSWGTMLQDAASVSVLREAPWMLAPAAAIFLVACCCRSASGRRLDLWNTNTRSRLCATCTASFLRSRPPSPADGDVDARAITANVQPLDDAPGSPACSRSARTAKRALLDEDESDRVVAAAREGVPRDRVLLVGTGRESTRATIAATRRAAALGADAVLVRTPSYLQDADDDRRARRALHARSPTRRPCRCCSTTCPA